MDSNKNSNEAIYFERWKHFDSIAGSDKDRMVTIVNWLLAFAVAILAYIAKETFNWKEFCLTSPEEALFFSIAGICICVNAFYLVSAFGAYANNNWYIAGEYANRIPYLIDYKTLKKRLEEKIEYSIDSYYYHWVAELSCRHDPTKGLAPIFLWYRNISLFFLVLFAVVFLWALIQSIDIMSFSYDKIVVGAMIIVVGFPFYWIGQFLLPGHNGYKQTCCGQSRC